MNFNFGEVLTRAWQIVWKHRVLWIFGILASCGRGGSNFNSSSNFQGDGGTGAPPDLPPQIMEIFQWIEQNIAAFVVGIFALACIIWIVTIFLSTIGKIGLIRGTAQIDGGAEGLIFGQLFSESTPYFWRVFGLGLLATIPFLVFAVVVAAAVLAYFIPLAATGAGNEPPPAFGFALIPLVIGCVCLLIPLAIIIGLVVRQAENAIVLEEMSVLPSISRGWEVFRTNLGPIIIMAIILAIIGFVASFIIAIPIFVILVPAFIAFMAGEAQNWTPLAIASVCVCLYIPISLLLSGIAIAFTESAWTLTYMRLTKPPVIEPVVLPEANA
ncbi:MAG TPA: hypothetical protein VJM08_01730 [Anaerolineales bacterium]|nr:hypothetical protein [Anaerolineales bacterium]